MKTLKLTKKYQVYPEYKDSGVEWFGKLPTDWKVGPLRSVLSERVEKNKKLVTDNILSVMKDRGVIRYADKGDIGNKSSDRPENYKIVHAGDIVLNSMNLVIGSVGQSKELGVTSSVYIIYYPKIENISAEYYHYLFRDKSWQKTLGRLGRGIMELRESIKQQDLKIEPVPIPSFETQQNIVTFLDEKTARVDSLIKKKKKLIALLREKRTAVINQAVTKGLDPNVELVDSGIEWIGKIPKRWEVKRLKHLARMDYGEPLPAENREDGEVNVYGSNGVVGSHIKANTQAPVILVGRKGSYGALNYSENPVFSIDTTYFIDTKCTKNNLRWLFYVLGCANLGALSQDTGVPGLSRSVAYEKCLPVPSISEQELLVNHLDEQASYYDQSIKKVEKSIELLQEFKSSLISHVVTGKVNV